MTLTTPKLIDTTDDITAPWLEEVLGHAGHDTSIASIAIEPIGAGNVSDTVRVSIAYARQCPGAPSAVVIKLRPRDPDVHAHGLRSGAYHREIGAYVDISARNACRIPLKYWVAGDETTINLVMEDLSTSAVAGNQVQGATVEDATAVLTELANVHSEFHPMDTATAPAWMIRLSDVCDYWSDAAERGAGEALTRFADDLPNDHLEAIRRAIELVRVWHLLPQEHLTFTHGDPRVDNVLFESVGDVRRAVLIDWQVTGLRNPMYDVGYFMSGSVDVADRRAHERRLITHYAETFANKSAGYDEATALRDYRVQLLSGLYITLAAIDVLPDNETVNTLILALLRRNCAAVVDWDSVAQVRAHAGDTA